MRENNVTPETTTPQPSINERRKRRRRYFLRHESLPRIEERERGAAPFNYKYNVDIYKYNATVLIVGSIQTVITFLGEQTHVICEKYTFYIIKIKIK